MSEERKKEEERQSECVHKAEACVFSSVRKRVRVHLKQTAAIKVWALNILGAPGSIAADGNNVMHRCTRANRLVPLAAIAMRITQSGLSY